MASTVVAAPSHIRDERSELHALVDLLSVRQLNALLPVLRILADDIRHDSEGSIDVPWESAPQDEEVLRPEVAARLQKSWDELESGGGVSHEEVLLDLLHE